MINTLNIGSILLSLIFSLGTTVPSVKDWISSSDQLFKGKWRESSRVRFLSCEADFNGDGVMDTAYIMQPVTGPGIGIFVSLSDRKGENSVVCIYTSERDEPTAGKKYADRINAWFRMNWGIRVAPAGRHKTACGKGYFDCRKGEPKEINMENQGIDFFHHDAGGNKFFYWDKNLGKFVSQQMSD